MTDKKEVNSRLTKTSFHQLYRINGKAWSLKRASDKLDKPPSKVLRGIHLSRASGESVTFETIEKFMR